MQEEQARKETDWRNRFEKEICAEEKRSRKNKWQSSQLKENT